MVSIFGKKKHKEDELRTEDARQRYQEAVRSVESKIVMQEILSKPQDAKKPLVEQEFAEIRIDDRTDSYRPGFSVSEWRIRWSEADQQFIWLDEQQELWASLLTAENRYDTRLRALKELGFSHSDIDF